MLPSDKTATRVGAALSVLLLAAIVIVLRIDFRDLGPSIRVRVYLKHPGPLRAAADVQLAGRKIGRVNAVRLVTAHHARSSEHPLHPRGGVELSVQLKKKYLPWVRKNSEIFVNSRGIIGESYLEVAPPPADEAMDEPLRDGDSVRGIDPARMEEIIVTSFMNARRFGALLDELEPSRSQLRADLEALSNTIDELVPDGAEPTIGESFAVARAELEELRETIDLEALPSPGSLQGQSKKLAARARSDFADLSFALDTLTGNLQTVKDRVPPDLWNRIDEATSDAKRTMARFESTVARVESLAEQVALGMGTVGALMNDKEFSDDAKKLGRYIKRHPWEFLTRPIDN